MLCFLNLKPMLIGSGKIFQLHAQLLSLSNSVFDYISHALLNQIPIFLNGAFWTTFMFYAPLFKH